MLSLLIRPLRQVVDIFITNDSPRQIAFGVAIGAVLGLVPKGNLLAVSLLILLFSVRANRTAGLLSAAFFAMISPLCDSFTHRLGDKLLAIDGMQSTYAWLYDMPLGPWFGFNNTVVLGAFVLGLYLTYPCYAASHLLVKKFQPPIAKWLMRYRLARWLAGADVTTRFGIPGAV